MMNMSTPRRSSVDHAKMPLLSLRKWTSSASVFPSSIAEMIICLLLLLASYSGTFFVSSVGFALVCCVDYFGEGMLAFTFSFPRLCTFFCPRATVSSGILARSWFSYTAMTPPAEGIFMER